MNDIDPNAVKQVRLVECPRDAMQGWRVQIPTAKKIEYLNTLLQVGFDTLDFGSFVSPKAIPQMADTKDVLSELEFGSSATKLLAIIANLRGAEEACSHSAVTYLGYPFSISETFQQRNTNSGISQSFNLVKQLVKLCDDHSKELVVYISMGFGNPYGDAYSEKIVYDWVNQLSSAGVRIISLADTVGLATEERVGSVTKAVVDLFPALEIGVHLHAHRNGWKQKVDAALDAGCLRFDGAVRGIGGCPMANNELVGNIDTILMIEHFAQKGLLGFLNHDALNRSIILADEIFAV